MNNAFQSEFLIGKLYSRNLQEFNIWLFLIKTRIANLPKPNNNDRLKHHVKNSIGTQKFTFT